MRRGRGIALGFKASIAPTTSTAIVNLYADGSAALYCGTVDMGQGSDTAMAQIVGEVLDMAAEGVRVVHPDTDVTPYDMGTLGSRSTYHMGHAVRLAAEEVTGKIAALAAELGLPAGSNMPVTELFRRKYGMQAGNIVGFGSFVPSYKSPDHDTGLTDNVAPFWMIGATGAEVEVDTETGHFRVLRLVNVADAGTPINPKIVETQLSGGAIMQLGFTVSEEMRYSDGQLTNNSLADYKIPGLLDMPREMENVAVDAAEPVGTVRRQGRRRDRDVRRLARHRERDRGCGGRAAHGIAADAGSGLSRPCGQARREPVSAAPRTIRFTLNGAAVSAEVAPHESLVELLDRRFSLFGARESCGQGLCGCCTVLVDGVAVSGCLYLAWFAEGARVETIEGLAAGERLDPVQDAFIEAGAFQCGFCTPGFILMTKQLLARNPDPTDDDIRHYLSGNLCRCSAYPEIVAAVQLAARKRRGA